MNFQSLSTWPSKLKRELQIVPAGLRLAWRCSPLLVLVAFFCTLLSALLPVGVAYAGKAIIDAVIARSAVSTGQWVWVELGLACGLVVTQRTLLFVKNLLAVRMGLRINSDILAKASLLTLGQIESAEYYDKLNRAWRESTSRPLKVVNDSFRILQNGILLFSYVIVLISYSPWIVCLLALASLPVAGSEIWFSNAGFVLENWRSPDRRRLAYLEYILTNETHAKEIRVLELARLFLNRYRKLGESLYKEGKTLGARHTTWAALLSSIASLAFYGCYFVMAIAAATGKLTLGNLTLYMVSLRQGQLAFQNVLADLGEMFENHLYLVNLFDFLSTPERPTFRPRLGPRPPQKQSGIVFDRVGFRYPGHEEWALRDIHLQIHKGQSVAIMGCNGAGKSTLIKLLCGLYEPVEGRILLDGRDLREWKREEVFARMGILFQDFNRYQFSFGENVGLGDVANVNDERRILSAVKQSGASEILEGMPKGLSTTLGRYFDGVELSGGQWQKVALARAFIRRNADILILDEPTAALDAESEKAVLEQFRTLIRGKTSLIISHRFPFARQADHIALIENGHLIEMGEHERLVAIRGRYHELFSMQASGYR